MSIIYLVVVYLSGTPFILVQQMPNAASCEAVGKAIAGLQKVKYVCTDTPVTQ